LLGLWDYFLALILLQIEYCALGALVTLLADSQEAARWRDSYKVDALGAL
jgi:hypothetical protein